MIRSLFVDLDGVIRLWDGKAAEVAEKKFGLPSGAMRRTAFAYDLVEPAILGRVTDEMWRENIAKRLTSEFPDADTIAAVQLWSAASGRVDMDALNLVQICRQQAQVILVTNATSRLASDLARLGIDDEFDVIINSSDIGITKPDPLIFEVALKKAGVSANEALFVDDRPENVSAAIELGIAGHVYVDTQSLKAVLRRNRLMA